MIRSKSRSGSVDFGQKNHYSSVFSRTLSASKLCRGDALGAQVDSKAHKSVDKKPAKVSSLSENRVDRVIFLQQQMGDMEEELRRTKEQLSACEAEKHQVLDQLKESKTAAQEANVRANEASLSSNKTAELMTELQSLKDLLARTQDESKAKDKKIESLESELGKALSSNKTEELTTELQSLKDLLARTQDELKAKDKKIESLESELGKALSSNKTEELTTELESLKNLLDSMRDESETKDKRIESLELEHGKALSSNKTEELTTELESLKNLLASTQDESKTKDKRIESLESECGKARQVESEKDASLAELNLIISENEKRIQELEGEVERAKQSESDMVDKLSKNLQATSHELEKSKIEISRLHENIESLQELSKQNIKPVERLNTSRDYNSKSSEGLAIASLKLELAQAQEGEKKALLRVESMADEMEKLKNEMRLAIDAEEKSIKAMEDLAMALKEVATESNATKEKLNMTQMELENVNRDVEEFKKLLDEAKQEAELHKNTADRLRVEAEESLLAWNGKEMGFMSCIKRAEEEKAMAQHECNKLSESLKAAENMTRAAREETYKLRDILKQAVNEANAAKAAAGIARDENSSLKDCLAEKEEAMHFLTKENERLRISEAAAHENVKQLKRFLSMGGSMDFKNLEVTTTTTNKEETDGGMVSFPEEAEDEEDEFLSHEDTITDKSFSFDREDLKFLNEPGDDTNEEVLDPDPEKAECLKGSIFDTSAETPRSEPHTPLAAINHIRRYSSAFTEMGATSSSNSEEFDHNVNNNRAQDDLETEKNQNKPKKTMFRRVGDLLAIRRAFQKKEQSIG